MKKTKTVALTLILFAISNLYAQDTLYFDKMWNETNRANHTYYRLLPQKEMQDIYYVQDFYKNGNIQMQGYVLKQNPKQYVGDVYWYDEQGFDDSYSQYENPTANKVLSYYHDDGKLWQKITYNDKGKKVEVKVYLNDKEIGFAKLVDNSYFVGSFSYREVERSYLSALDENGYHEAAHIAQPYQDEENDYSEQKSKSNSNKTENYLINIFWKNGHKAAEQKVIYEESHNTKKSLERFWDQSGKLLSQVNHAEENFYTTPHVKYTYYTKNGIAYSVAKQESYIGYNLDGPSIHYAHDGTIKQQLNYDDGRLTKVEIFDNNKIVQTNLYEEGKPYDGKFKINQNLYVNEFILNKGQKIGRETWQNTEDGSYFSDGEYKNFKPWSGNFAIEDSLDYTITLHNYKNGVLEGTQKKFPFLTDRQPMETYEMKNGILEGIRKVYIGGDEVIESMYKNDKIWEGKIPERTDLLTYKNGILIHKKIGSILSDEIIEIEEFYHEDGTLDKVLYRNFFIDEYPQQYYEGIYKNGKPQNGYFQLDTLIDNIKLIDYYENGNLKYKFSFDFLQEIEGFKIDTYTIKSTYNNSKIVDGPTYQLVGNSILLETLYKTSVPIQFKINVFGMHYFNQYVFSLEKDKIKVAEINSPKWLEIHNENNTYLASLVNNSKIIRSSSLDKNATEGAPNSLVFYYLKDNKIHTSVQKSITEQVEEDDKISMVNQLFFAFPIKSSNPVKTLFLEMLESAKTENNMEKYLFSAFEKYAPFPDEAYLSIVQYDEQGKIPYGIRIVQDNDQIRIEGIYENEIKKTLTFKNIAELLKEDKAALKKLELELLNNY
ncbi:hypothetical protein [Sphingobacterium bovistauri]|uniref:Antitoxin component YwqK of the YwqJK toxin-antitoxin module n=1 Tax=Sphingobacterium bovistauri TaxID=2781959 RepID=A0ABS7Z2P4_9SPHI|nr:hypothetical protein [Sphingobacterium bovistauri]MCA5004417.1 hypothetical protein [Sphingobacterium bovistauri]